MPANVKALSLAPLGLPKRFEHELRVFCEGLLDAYWGKVKSLIVYGSLARKEYVPERSDVNLLIVLEAVDLAKLEPTLELVAKAREGCRVTPFFLSPHDIETSRDVFPIKFHDMQDAYVAIYGEDVLADMHVSDLNLRLEVEQEMKILLLELRQFYLQRSRKLEANVQHFATFISSYLYLLKYVLKLVGVEPPAATAAMVDAAAKRFDLDLPLMRRLLDLKRGKPSANLQADLLGFYGAVQQGADLVDKLVVAGAVA